MIKIKLKITENKTLEYLNNVLQDFINAFKIIIDNSPCNNQVAVVFSGVKHWVEFWRIHGDLGILLQKYQRNAWTAEIILWWKAGEIPR